MRGWTDRTGDYGHDSMDTIKFYGLLERVLRVHVVAAAESAEDWGPISWEPSYGAGGRIT